MGKLRTKFNKFTEGPVGYIVYAALGIFIAFLLNQTLALALATDLPVVAVVSSSMSHEAEKNVICGKTVQNYDAAFDNWWEACNNFYAKVNITKEQFGNFPIKDGFLRGDLPIIQGEKEYKIGDVIVYSAPCEGAPIIHRIVQINQDGSMQTKGDHNVGQIPPQSCSAGTFDEKHVPRDQIHGKVIFVIPKLGYFKVFATSLLGGSQ